MKGRYKQYLISILIIIGMFLYLLYGQDDLVKLNKLHHVNRMVVTNNETASNFEIFDDSLPEYFDHTYGKRDNDVYETKDWREIWKVEYYEDDILIFDGAIIGRLKTAKNNCNQDFMDYEDYYYMYRIDIKKLFVTRKNYSRIDAKLIQHIIDVQER